MMIGSKTKSQRSFWSFENKIKVNFSLFLCMCLFTHCSIAQADTISAHEPFALKFISLDGNEINIKSLRGKIVLIDCWATWCSPCLKEIPRIKKLYERYHEFGFEVIGISMDDFASKTRVKQIVERESIPWPQRFEGKGFNEDTFRKQFDIKSLPTMYLIDRKGNIVDTNARAARLELLIIKYLEL